MTADVFIPLVICILGMCVLGVLAIDTARKLEAAETHLERLRPFTENLVARDIERQLEMAPADIDLERALTTVELHRQTIEELRQDNVALAKSLVAAQQALTRQPD